MNGNSNFSSMTHVKDKTCACLEKVVLEELRRRRHQRDTRQQFLLTLCTESENKELLIAGRGCRGSGDGWEWVVTGSSKSCLPQSVPSWSPRLIWPLKAPTTLASFLSCKHHLCSHRPSSSGEVGGSFLVQTTT